MEVLQYTRHFFRARDYPTCAIFALHQTARDNVENFPEASGAVLTRFYLDDYLDSFDNPDEARTISKDLLNLDTLGGFSLTKFVSNVPANE